MILAFISRVVLVFISLKLLQSEQSNIINEIFHRKSIVLNAKNNKKHTQEKITNKDYTYIFISFEIALLKKFK